MFCLFCLIFFLFFLCLVYFGFVFFFKREKEYEMGWVGGIWELVGDGKNVTKYM